MVQLAAQYKAGPNRNVLGHTVQRTQRLRSKYPTHVPLLTKCHRQLRLRWAREHRDWTIDQWKRVSWSDESRFAILHADGRIRIHCLPGERLLSQCITGHTKASGGCIMLCGTFSWASLEPVVVLEQTLNAMECLNIIANQLHLDMVPVFPTENGKFQQKNVPCQSSICVGVVPET